MWSSNFIIEVEVKFGVLLAIPRNEARKNPRNHASCSSLTGAFDAKKKLNNGWFKIFEVICTLPRPPFIQLESHL